MEKPIFIWNTPGRDLWPESHVITDAFLVKLLKKQC